MITKTLRFPEPLLEIAETVASETGMSLNDLVVHALSGFVGAEGDPAIRLLARLREWLRTTFTADFPDDVTLRTFQQIRSDPDLWVAYEKCISDANGQPVPELRGGLNRRIGLLVKLVLKADVVGRSLPLDARVHLISSYALLRPATRRLPVSDKAPG